MSSMRPHCQITAKDFTILEVILERASPADRLYRCLLQQKLSTATVVFREDVDPQVATLNSRVEYSVDDGPVDNRILVHGDEYSAFALTLPIRTLRGLALLGLRSGDSIMIDRVDGLKETLHLRRIAYQPEAARRSASSLQPMLPGLEPLSERGARIVELRPHRGPNADNPTMKAAGPSDDDPGPPAA